MFPGKGTWREGVACGAARVMLLEVLRVLCLL